MGTKKFRLTEGFLIAVFIYVTFISILYLRMKNAEQQAVEYSSARSCILPSNCREILQVNAIEHKFSKMSFTNYGSRGLPIKSGSFQRYVFVLSTNGLKNEIVYVLPNELAFPEDFDLPNVYLPVKSDATLINADLFKDKTVYVETWQDTITLILIRQNVEDDIQPHETPQPVETTLGHTSTTYEMILATDQNPVLYLIYARNDFNGWTFGVLSMVVFMGMAGGLLYVFTESLNWINSKWRQDD